MTGSHSWRPRLVAAASGVLAADGTVSHIAVENREATIEFEGLDETGRTITSSGVQFIGANVRDEAPTAASFSEKFGVTYPSIIDGLISATVEEDDVP